MNLLFTPKAWSHYLYWQAEDAHVLQRINALIKDARRDPSRGIGKPEPLKRDLRNYWSRRITVEHRLICTVTGSGAQQQLVIVQCRFHYDTH